MRSYNTLAIQGRRDAARPGAYTSASADLSGLRAL